MGKRVLISLIAIMSLGTIWWTDAVAATCLQYRTIGGSSFCTAWSTGSVNLEVTFKEACLVSGTEFATCTAIASVLPTSDNKALCSKDGGLTATPVDCAQSTTWVSTQGVCEPKHPDKDGTSLSGVGHEHHGCTVTFHFEPSLATCTSCCTAPGGPGGVCVDVTPVEMTTNVTVFAADSGGDGDVFLTQAAQSCGDSSSCSFSELCSINPKKIAYLEERPYQCNLITEETE